MRVLITGANGFIAKNLRVHLELAGHDALLHTRDTSDVELVDLVRAAEFVFHVAGVNRPET